MLPFFQSLLLFNHYNSGEIINYKNIMINYKYSKVNFCYEFDLIKKICIFKA